MSERVFYITTPIYYVNAEPHIGHTYTTVVTDTLARYHRLCGEDTFFLTGTDEHGEKIQEVADERGKPVAEVAAFYSDKFRETWEKLGLSYDRFIRTTDPDHKEIVQRILQKVYDDGHIEFREYEGDYCVGCERFLTDRDMKDGLCLDHERAPERRSESNYFFKMREHFEWLSQHIRDHKDFIRPERYRNEVLSMLRDDSGLGDLCISRPKARLDWGIELPFDDNYVCYVWFDALINYLTGIGYPDDEQFAARWASAQHVIGKDILKPHAIFWPTMLHAIGLEPYQHLNVHGYWNVDNRKISKTLGNMISPLVMDEKYGFESFRYYLLRDMSFGLDGSFTEELLVSRLNAELANGLGNLVSRTLNMTKRYADGRVPEPAETGELEAAVVNAAERAVALADEHMRAVAPHRAMEAIHDIVNEANRYLELRQPWTTAKDPERMDEVRTTLYTCCEALRIIALLYSPFMPEKCAEIASRLGLEGWLADARLPADAAWGRIPVGSTTTKGGPLFPRIEPESDNADKG